MFERVRDHRDECPKGTDFGPVLLIGENKYLRQACADRDLTFLTCADSARIAESGVAQLPGETILHVADYTSPELVLNALACSEAASRRIRAVLSSKEAGVVNAACLGAALGAHAVPVGAATTSREKSLQKFAVSQAGLACASVRYRGDAAGLRSLLDERAEEFRPAVVKPVNGVACTGTRIVRTRAELESHVRDSGEFAEGVYSTVLVEDFIEIEQEWLVDGVMRGGAVEFLSLSRYVRPCVDVQHGFVNQIYTLDRERNPGEYALAVPFAERALKAVGIDKGVFHLEVYRAQGKEGLYFGECAVRTAGSGVPDVLRKKYGVNLLGIHVDVVLGLPSQEKPVRFAGAAGKTTLPSVAGTVVEAPDTAELRALSDVFQGSVALRVGEPAHDMREENREFGGIAMLATGDEASLVRRMREIVAWFSERVVIETPDGHCATLLELGRREGLGFALESGS